MAAMASAWHRLDVVQLFFLRALNAGRRFRLGLVNVPERQENDGGEEEGTAGGDIVYADDGQRFYRLVRLDQWPAWDCERFVSSAADALTGLERTRLLMAPLELRDIVLCGRGRPPPPDDDDVFAEDDLFDDRGCDYPPPAPPAASCYRPTAAFLEQLKTALATEVFSFVCFF